MVPNQGLQGIAFFEATACLTLLVLFVHLKRDNHGDFLPVVVVRLDLSDSIVFCRTDHVLSTPLAASSAVVRLQVPQRSLCSLPP